MALEIGREVRDYMIWAEEFQMKDDGVDAFIAVQKLRTIEILVREKSEGWGEALEDVLGL